MAEALNAAVRNAARGRRIPDGAQCADCGCSDPRVLEPYRDGWRCYECASARRGKPITEEHHVLSKSVHPATVPLPGNLHRVLNDQQKDLPAEVRRAAPRDGLAFAATVAAAVRDFFLVVAQLLGAAIDWLLRLRDALKARYGAGWQQKLGLPPMFPRAAA